MSQSDLAQWSIRQYLTATGAADLEGGARFQDFVGEFPVRSSGSAPYPLSGIQRAMSNFLNMRMKIPLGPAGYYCLSMRAALKGLPETIFGFAYWRRDAPSQLPEYICIAPTYESQDGEYRPRFVRYPEFTAAYEKYASKLAPFEIAVLELVKTGTLALKLRVSPENPGGEIARVSDEARLAVCALTVGLGLDLGRVGQLDPHTNSSYRKLLVTLSAMPALAKLGALYIPTLRNAYQISSALYGQKLVPMTLRETMQPFDYNLAAWRELLVTQLASDLLLNLITPSVAIYNQWSYIEDAGREVFENRAMLERFARSQTSDAVMKHLRAARHEIAESSLGNYYTTELDAHVYESLEYAQSNLTLSGVAILHTMENVGVTFGSLATTARNENPQHRGIAAAVATLDSAAKLFFELAYGVHCIHTKLGVAHTDLHRNNHMVHYTGLVRPPITKVNPKPTPYYDDPVAMYVAGPRGEADSFVFPANGIQACIIDFSRAILGPGFRTYLAEGRSPQFVINFYRDQVNRVIRTLHRYAPDYVTTHQDALKAAAIADLESVFAALCAVDFIAIGAGVAAALRDEIGRTVEGELQEFVVSEEAIRLATRLEEAGREALITSLHAIVRGKGAKPGLPGAMILREVFGSWLYSAQNPKDMKGAQLVDVYNINNELRYSGRDYERFPPWGRFDEIERHLGEYKMTDVFERGIDPFLEAGVPGPRVQVIAEKTRAAQEKLDGKPVSTASSWID